MNFDATSWFEWIVNNIQEVLRQLGGVGIITAICSFIAYRMNKRFEGRIANRFENQIETLKLELDNQRERYKAILEKRNYVSKIRFDTEFSLCREIVIACRKMIDDVYFVFPTYARIPADKTERKEYENKVYSDAIKSYSNFVKLLSGNAPFISANIYNQFMELVKLCKQNLDVYSMRWDKGFLDNLETSPYYAKAESEAYDRTTQFEPKFSQIVESLRQYFTELDVLE